MESCAGLMSLVLASTRELNLLIPAGLAVGSAGELGWPYEDSGCGSY